MKNKISSTLFRFKSLRSPQKPEEHESSATSIKIESALETGLFFDAIINMNPSATKREALMAASTIFEASTDCLREVKEVKLLNPDLFLFSEWIVRNRDKYEETEFQTKAQAVGGPLSQNLSKVWNNLFYQFITMKSFNIKEALMQMLLADHIVRNLKRDVNESAYNNLLVNAQVILPAFLFDESNRLFNPSNENSAVVSVVPPDDYMKKKLAIAKANFSNIKLKTLKKELEVLEKTHRKEFQQEYETAYSTHQSKINPILEDYRNEVENEKK
uniref:hypothetical protein n=1 Tax=Flavobacterium sp. TaxID=239 RepID=UPI00404A1AB3